MIITHHQQQQSLLAGRNDWLLGVKKLMRETEKSTKQSVGPREIRRIHWIVIISELAQRDPSTYPKTVHQREKFTDPLCSSNEMGGTEHNTWMVKKGFERHHPCRTKAW